MWEDERNRRGGRWVINLNKSQRAQSLDKIWLEVMLCLIGEAFDDHSKYVSQFSFLASKAEKINNMLKSYIQFHGM